jgi:hypothetical protein
LAGMCCEMSLLALFGSGSLTEGCPLLSFKEACRSKPFSL